MLKQKIIIKICCFVLLFFSNSCLNNQKVLPESTGLVNEIVVVYDEKNPMLSHKDIFNLFSAPTKGLSRYEPEFKVISIRKSEFSNFFKTHTNILIVNDNQFSLEKLKPNTDNKVSYINNVWSQDQLVVVINTHNVQIKDVLYNLKKSKDTFLEKEINYVRKSLIKKSSKIFDISTNKAYPKNIIIPNEYTIIKDSSDIFWAAHNPANSEQIKHILIFSLNSKTHLTNKDTSLLESNTVITNKVNSVLKLIRGSKKNSHITIESEFPIQCSNNICRGLWRLENGFMGGPFLYKIYPNSQNTTIALGLVFYPNKNKRVEMKKFEAGL